MTPVTTTPQTRQTTDTADATAMLRDMAFVLRMTRRVKDAIRNDPAGRECNPNRGPQSHTSALGVVA